MHNLRMQGLRTLSHNTSRTSRKLCKTKSTMDEGQGEKGQKKGTGRHYGQKQTTS